MNVTDTALTAAERRFWFMHRSGSTGVLVWPNAVRLHGAVDIAALGRAWSRFAERHDVVRTRFTDRGNGQPQRSVDPLPPVPAIPVTDLRGLCAADVPGAVRTLVAKECTATADLRTGPVLRSHVVHLPDPGGRGEHLLLVTGHNVVLDNWSVGLLWRDLGALYRAEVTGTADGLPEVRTSMAGHARRQSERITTAGTAGLAQLADRHRDLPVSRLPHQERPDRADPAGPRSELITFTVPAADVRALRRRAAGPASDFMLLFAAFAETVCDVLGRDDILLGTSGAGRSPDVFDTLGYFANRVAVRVDRSRRHDLAETLRRVTREVYSELGETVLPFEHVLEHLHPEQYLMPAPLLDLMFVMAGEPEPVDFGELAADVEPIAEPLDRFGLLLSVEKTATGFAVRAHRGVAHAGATEVRAVIARFTALVAGAPLTVTAD